VQGFRLSATPSKEAQWWGSYRNSGRELNEKRVLNMSVVIRLSRGGRTNLPVYMIVAADSRRAATGKFIERLGYFHPHAQGAAQGFVLDEARLTEWVGKGAQVSDAVTRLLIKHNIGPAKVKEEFKAYKGRRIKAQEHAAAFKAKGEAAKAAKEGAPAAEAAPDEAAAPAPVEAAAAPAVEAAPAEAAVAEAPAAEAAAPAAE
jgi:small subunit ribosomal protein S16